MNSRWDNCLVSEIIQIIERSNFVLVHFVWVPSHVGVTFNERADNLAKLALDYGAPVGVDYSIDWTMKLISKELWSKWNTEYSEISQTKGSFHYFINPNVPLKPWYRGFSLDPGEVKIFNRLLSGHAYDKKFLNLIRVNDSSLCDTCNIVENANHLIFHCSKFCNIRGKYAIFDKYDNLANLLKEYNKEAFSCLIKFVKECGIFTQI